MVAITTSHSGPYKTKSAADSVRFVKAWVKDKNIDIISPQLYSSGNEAAPEFAETSSCKSAGCTWSLYKGYKGKFVPSLAVDSHYPATQKFFKDKYGMTTAGFF